MRASEKVVDDFMTVQELASYLKVTQRTLYGWMAASKGPRALKLGRFIRYRSTDVENWLNRELVCPKKTP